MNEIQPIDTTAPAAGTSHQAEWELCEDDVIIYADPATLLDSPFQPRTVYNEAKLREGAETMMPPRGRMLQPMVVRDVSEAARPLFSGIDTVVTYELVFGHRRKRMALMAGLRRAPIIVRKMTDQQVKLAQIIENLHRDDVHAFDEAEGMLELMREHGKSADDIVTETGKSRSYVYGRIKLLQACAEIRQSCLAGEIGAEVALLIARLRHPKLQQRALGYIKGKGYDLKDGGKRSYRSVKDLLNERFTLDLKSAPFPTDATNLAGAGDCATCPKRSANAPEYQDVAEDKKEHRYSHQNLGPNVCTDPDCFAAKKAAHFKNQADAHRKTNREVIDGNRARSLVSATGEVKGGYLPLAQVKSELQRAKLAAQGSGGKIPMPAAVLIQDPRTGKTFEAVKESELVAAGTRKAAAKGSTATQADRRQEGYEEKRKREEAEAEQMTAKHMRWLQRVRAAARDTPRGTFDLRLVLDRMLELISCETDEATLIKLYDVDGIDVLRDRLQTMTADELGLLLMDCALVRYVEIDRWELDKKPLALISAASHYGVELTFDPASTPSTPSTAARAQEEGTAGGVEWPWPGDEAQSKAALAPADASAKQPAGGELQPVKAWPFPGRPPAAKTKSQAASGGKVAKGAGSAGVSSSTTPADAGGVGAES